MNPAQQIFRPKLSRHVIIIHQKAGQSGQSPAFLAVCADMRVAYKWIKAEGGIAYLNTTGAPLVINHYQTIFRAFDRAPSIQFSIRSGEQIQHYYAHKMQIIKTL